MEQGPGHCYLHAQSHPQPRGTQAVGTISSNQYLLLVFISHSISCVFYANTVLKSNYMEHASSFMLKIALTY